MSVLKVKFNRPGYQTEFDIVKVDDRFNLFWHFKRIGSFLSFKQALDFAKHLGDD